MATYEMRSGNQMQSLYPVQPKRTMQPTQQAQQQQEDWMASPLPHTLIDCGLVENQLEFADAPDTDGKYSDATDMTAPAAAVADMAKQAWEWACWSGEKTWDGLDFAGEVVANFLGLTRSKYQWMLDAEERDEENRRQRKLEARQRRQLRLEQLLELEKRKLAALEAGGDNQRDHDNDDDYDECDFDTDNEDNNNNQEDGGVFMSTP